MSPPDLLQSALKRAALQAAESENPSPRARASPPTLDSLSLSSSSTGQASTSTGQPPGSHSQKESFPIESEDDLIAVLTPSATPFGTPTASRNTSRSSSPTRRSSSNKLGGGGAGKPRRDKSKELAKSQANKLGADGTGSRDPLVKFEREVTGRIFGGLGSEDLLACGGVCKKWRGSQTLSQSFSVIAYSQSQPWSKERKYWTRTDIDLRFKQIIRGTTSFNRSPTSTPLSIHPLSNPIHQLRSSSGPVEIPRSTGEQDSLLSMLR